eukprot:scaffold114_cov361-Pinguiococcus_pyrenoidosus.AAC.23
MYLLGHLHVLFVAVAALSVLAPAPGVQRAALADGSAVCGLARRISSAPPKRSGRRTGSGTYPQGHRGDLLRQLQLLWRQKMLLGEQSALLAHGQAQTRVAAVAPDVHARQAAAARQMPHRTSQLGAHPCNCIQRLPVVANCPPHPGVHFIK